MWDTAINTSLSTGLAGLATGLTTGQASVAYLSHDLPCVRCGHAPHRYLSCSTTCDCVPPPVPGSVTLFA